MKVTRALSLILAFLLLMTGMTMPAFAEEPVKLTAAIYKHALTKPLEEIEWLRLLEEETNVDITWTEYSSDWEMVRSTVFASSDVPDIMIHMTADTDFQTFEGLFLDLKPLINETDTPNIFKFHSEHPEAEQLCLDLDGHLYNLGNYNRVWPYVYAVSYINKTWLDNLGLEVPTTWEEMKEVLIAFRDQDANGNGDPTDEVPMDMAGTGAYSAINWIGSTGIQLTSMGVSPYFADEGELNYLYVDERYKDWVVYMNELWEEDLIYSGAFTDSATYMSRGHGDGTTSTIGVGFAWDSQDIFGMNLADEYVVLPQLKQYADQEEPVRYLDCYTDMNYYTNKVSISSACEDVDAALRFVDKLYDPEWGIQCLWGGMNDVDKGVEKLEDGTFKVLAPADANVSWGEWKWINTWADYGISYLPEDMKIIMGDDMVRTISQRSAYDECYADVPNEDRFVELFMKYTADESKDMTLISTAIGPVVSAKQVAWITGEADINAEWDAYVEEIYGYGLQDILDIKQDKFDAWLDEQ